MFYVIFLLNKNSCRVCSFALMALCQACHDNQVSCGLSRCSLSDRFVENSSRLLASAFSACIDLPTLALSSCTDMSTIASLTTLAAVATESWSWDSLPGTISNRHLFILPPLPSSSLHSPVHIWHVSGLICHLKLSPYVFVYFWIG